MRIKRFAALLLAALLILTLTGCGVGKSKNAAMSIHPVQLTQEEEGLAQLLDVELDNYRIFDFQMGDKPNNVQTIQLTVYELVDMEWSVVSQEREAFLDATGRIALCFGKLTEGVRAAVQSEGGFIERSFTAPPGDDASSMTAYLTSSLKESPSMEFDKEVPLVVQIATSKSEINSYDVSSFYTPAQFEKRGYEHIYAITVMFSQKTAAELARDAQKGNQ